MNAAADFFSRWPLDYRQLPLIVVIVLAIMMTVSLYAVAVVVFNSEWYEDIRELVEFDPFISVAVARQFDDTITELEYATFVDPREIDGLHVLLECPLDGQQIATRRRRQRLARLERQIRYEARK